MAERSVVRWEKYGGRVVTAILVPPANDVEVYVADRPFQIAPWDVRADPRCSHIATYNTPKGEYPNVKKRRRWLTVAVPVRGKLTYWKGSQRAFDRAAVQALSSARPR